jgi:serine phosphatase RsbU (regulator of sigma subunit)/pSer/pThr/pTyr-binding forkhead associated (FHA) protein
MASLLVLKGANPGTRIKLEPGDLFIIGRSPDCQIQIPNNAVSRQHAKITRIPTGYWIEDLDSRNGTLVNNQKIEQKTQLKDNDKIKICDSMFTFHNESSTPSGIEIHDDDQDSPSTVHASVSRMPAQDLLQTQPSDKLRALLKVSETLGKAFEEENVLPQIAEILFDVFKQADRCFVIARDENTEQLIPKVIRTRRQTAETSARFSKTIVKRVIESGQALLYEDAQSGGTGQMALSASIAEFRIRSVMCAPLINQDGNAFGLIQLDSQDRNKTFTQDDLKLLVGVANQASIALENAKLHNIAVEVAVKQQDEEIARKVQRSFLPQRLPDIQAYQFYAFYQAAKNVGGDYYDFIPHGDNKLGILLGDVAGKGMAAALLMAKLSAEARYCLLIQPEIAKAIGRLNEQLLQAGMMDRFVTLAACLLDPNRNAVTFVNAGHMSPLIYRAASRTLEESISNKMSGFPLGMVEGVEYEFATVDLQPGDNVIIFTDGVTDALNAENASFGMDRVRAAILGNTDVPGDSFTPQQMGKRIIAAVQNHSQGQVQNDDIALVCFGRLEGPQFDAGSGRISTATGPMTQTIRRAHADE